MYSDVVSGESTSRRGFVPVGNLEKTMFFQHLSNYREQNSCSSSTLAGSLAHVAHASVFQGFAEAPQANISRIPPAQGTIFTPQPTPRPPPHPVPTTQNAIFIPQPPDFHAPITMPQPANANLTPRPKPAESTYEITLLQFCDPRVTTCHGCRQKNRFLNQPVPLPHNLVIVTKMRRMYYEDGQERVGKLGNVYFHCRADCVKKKQPLFFRESVTSAPNIQDLLTPEHQQTIRSLVAE